MNRTCVLDAGALLHRIPWAKKETYSEILNQTPLFTLMADQTPLLSLMATSPLIGLVTLSLYSRAPQGVIVEWA